MSLICECEPLRTEVATLKADNRRLRNVGVVDRFGSSAPANNGSDTSLAAAESMRGQGGILRQQILDWARTNKPDGFTCAQAELWIIGSCHQSISARIRELVLEGAIEDSGERANNPLSGRSQRVYKLTEPKF